MPKKLIFAWTISLLSLPMLTSDYSPACTSSAECHKMKTSAYYCSHFKSCIHFPMYLSPDPSSPTSQQAQAQAETTSQTSKSASVEESLESDRQIVLNYLSNTYQIRTSSGPGSDPSQ